jgi:carbon storage regulator CsrA
VLVLSRRLGEKIVLPSLGITVQVVAIKGNVVRLGISAPDDVTVLRQEVLERGDAPAGTLDAPCPAARQPCYV